MQRFCVDVNAKHNPRFGTLFFPNNIFFLFYFFSLFISVPRVGGKNFTDAVASFLYCRDVSYNNEEHLHMKLVVRVWADAAAETFIAYF